uniref:Small hydrophobic 5.88 kDa protein n=1 Tax=Ginger chlorotic fleck-associated virus TaxID=2739639 RepID=A0A6M8F5F4_9CLOS|nr:small hydrophobic 5.88 kDa protein [Ginger chlorotic fleck-associated virus]
MTDLFQNFNWAITLGIFIILSVCVLLLLLLAKTIFLRFSPNTVAPPRDGGRY